MSPGLKSLSWQGPIDFSYPVFAAVNEGSRSRRMLLAVVLTVLVLVLVVVVSSRLASVVMTSILPIKNPVRAEEVRADWVLLSH